jgi:hypothetical protein
MFEYLLAPTTVQQMDLSLNIKKALSSGITLKTFMSKHPTAEDIILQDALHSSAQLQSTFRTMKDYIDLYEAAGCPRELLVKRMTGVPSFRMSSSAGQRRRRRRESAVGGGALSTDGSTVAQEGDIPEPPLYHVSAPRDPLPSASVHQRNFNHHPLRPVGVLLAEKRVDLEATLEELRLEESAPHREKWLQQVHKEGRASDIVRQHASQLQTSEEAEQEIYLTLKRPDGRRTRFEAMVSERSLARPVAVTLQRRNPTNCHRSQHYPTAPSSSRLEKLPLPDRPTPSSSARSDVPTPPLLLTSAASVLPLTQPISPSKPSAEIRKWQHHMGLVTATSPLYDVDPKPLDAEASAQYDLLKSVATLLRL